jgi:GMP synthase-like glutamine amidotransferase
VIVYVDLEHERLRQDADLWRVFASKTLETKYRLETISGEACLIVRYDRVAPATLGALDVRAVVVGGHYTQPRHYEGRDLEGLLAVFRQPAWPTFSICGGFQLMAQTYGAQFSPMADAPGSYPPDTPTPPDGPDPGPDTSGPETRQERGFLPIRVLESHPLFENLGPQPVVFQLHSWEVKSAPAGFRVLAESDLCQIQILAHQSAPLFGAQFHPEHYDNAHPDGRTILENFFKMM